jgi:hypothetical protein
LGSPALVEEMLFAFDFDDNKALILDVSSLLNPTARTDLSKIRTFEEPSSMIVIDTPDSVFSSILGQE